MIITDSAATTSDCYIEVTDHDLEPYDHLSHHDHQYSANFRKRFVKGPFLCDRCGCLLTLWQDLCEHIKRVHRSRATDDSDDDQLTSPLPCTNTKTAVKHVGQKKTSRDDESTVCHICGWVRTASSQTLARHMRVHVAPIHVKCKHCSLKLLSGNLRRHEMLHAAVQRFLCQHCARSFQQRTSLVTHISRYHADKSSYHADKSGTSSKQSFPCQYCDEVFCSTYSVRKHTQLQHPTAVCKKCDLPVSSCNHYWYRERYWNRAFGCSVCNVAYTSVERLNQHMSLHGTHIGSGVKLVYKCQLCSERFELMDALVRHAADVHLVVNPQHSCRVCGKFYRIEAQLKQHMRVHTDNAFTCAMCLKKFEFKSAFVEHMSSHDKTFAKFMCSTCGKRFPKKQLLSVHERIHSGVKPYTCSTCGRAFRQQNHLNQHWRTHTEVKPYCCSHCDKAYKNRLDLRIHCTKVHNVELPLVRRKPALEDTHSTA